MIEEEKKNIIIQAIATGLLLPFNQLMKKKKRGNRVLIKRLVYTLLWGDKHN